MTILSKKLSKSKSKSTDKKIVKQSNNLNGKKIPIPSHSVSALVSTLAKHVPLLLQLIKTDPQLEHYINYNQVTKCYNTATTLLFFLTQTIESLRRADVDCHSKLSSSNLQQADKLRLLTALKKDMMKTDDGHYLYYILMNVDSMHCDKSKVITSDDNERGCQMTKKGKTCNLNTEGGKQTKSKKINLEDNYNAFNSVTYKTFPGHVFIIERAPKWIVNAKTGKEKLINEYFLYQSYINKFTLKDQFRYNGQTFKISKAHVNKILTGMADLFRQDRWDAATTQFYMDFAKAYDASKFEGCSMGEVKPCYIKYNIQNIHATIAKIRTYLQRKLKEVRDNFKAGQGHIYNIVFEMEEHQNSKSKIGTRTQPYTVEQMETAIIELLNRIEKIEKNNMIVKNNNARIRRSLKKK
jgi:hypothetical protein